MNQIGRIILTILWIVLIIVFWKPLLWLSIILLALALVYTLITAARAAKIRDEIAKDPDAYFRAQEEEARKRQENVMDAEYTERTHQKENEKS